MDKSNWEYKENQVGIYILDISVKKYKKNLIRLPRYEYEDFDTYEIPDSNHSKLFVQNEFIKAIQCGLAFYYQDINLIGFNTTDALNILGRNYKYDTDGEVFIYQKEKIRIRLYSSDDNIIRWVIIDSWESDL